jgi:transketolase
MFAAHYKLDSIIGVVDWNGQQIDGPNEKVMSLGDLEAKWTAFGWNVMTMDGHSFESIHETMAIAQDFQGKGKPTVILMKTDMGHGVDFMAGTHEWHGKAPNDEQLATALSQLEETLGDY